MKTINYFLKGVRRHLEHCARIQKALIMKIWMQVATLITWIATVSILVRRVTEERLSAITLNDNSVASSLVQKIETVLSENENLKAAIFDEMRYTVKNVFRFKTQILLVIQQQQIYEHNTF